MEHMHENMTGEDMTAMQLKNLHVLQQPMDCSQDCFLVPGPVRMGQPCLNALATPVITARGTEYRDVMAQLNSGLRNAFNLAPSQPLRGVESWSGDDDYKGCSIAWTGEAHPVLNTDHMFFNCY